MPLPQRKIWSGAESASPGFRPDSAPAPRRPPRWHRLYFLLAAFDLLTIGVSLGLNRQLIRVHTEAVRVNHEWSDRRARLSELGPLAADVNAPGNDVFDSRNVSAETERLRAALEVFEEAVAARRQDLIENVTDGNGPRLVRGLDEVGAAMGAMVDEAQRIFDFFAQDKATLAGERMATMDRKFALINVRLAKLRGTIQEIQNESFARQNKVLESLRRYEYMIAIAIVPMVCGIAFYGHKLSQNVARTMSEKEQDLIAIQASEARAQRAHAEAEALLSTISAVFIGVDIDAKVARWNAAAAALFTIPSHVVLGQRFTDCGIHWEWSVVEAAIVDALGSGKSRELNEVPYTRPDGKDGVLHLVVTPAVQDSMDNLAFTLLATDITERRALESQLRQAQKLESIGQLAAGIAHEINTPTQFVGDNLRFLQDAFRSVQSVIDLLPALLEHAGSDEAEDVRRSRAREVMAAADLDYLRQEIPQAIGQSLEGVTRIAGIVQAMKDFSHPDAAEQKPTDLNRCIEATITVARSEWKYVAELITDFDPNLPLVLCLPGEVNQVILNLIVNAAHAIADTPPVQQGGKGQITVATRHQGDEVEIRVTDTGTGIPEAARGKLFDPFFTTKPVGKGTGQGLYIAHNVIVEKHGGTVRFETELGRGTTFIVSLPVHAAGSRSERKAA